MTIRPRRSVLYLPASNGRAIEKAKTLDCDVVVLDLEDAVAPAQKETARAQACQAIESAGFGRREVVVRINALESAWGKVDLAAVAKLRPDAILVPKVSQPVDLERVNALLVHAPAATRIWAMMETPLAVLNCAAIAQTARAPGSRLACFVIGTNDLVKETRAVMDADRRAAQYWLSAILTAGRAYGLDVIDGVYNEFRDAEGLRLEAHQGRQLGMDGKSLIHPGQIAIANGVFSPSQDEVAAAQRIVAAFDHPENAGRGVIELDGRMVELLHRDMALRTVTLARAIGSASAGA